MFLSLLHYITGASYGGVGLPAAYKDTKVRVLRYTLQTAEGLRDMVRRRGASSTRA